MAPSTSAMWSRSSRWDYDVDFYFVVWAPLLRDRANTVMILKTCAALARRAPDWRVHLRCAEAPPDVGALARSLGVAIPANLDIAPMFDTGKMSPAEAETRIADVLGGGRGAASRKWAEQWRRDWARRVAGQSCVIHTRNIALLTFFREELGEACPTLFLELHQLKYRAKALGECAAPRLGDLKRAVRRTRDAEIARIRQADVVFCISQAMRDQVAGLAPDLPLETLPSGADFPASAGEANAGADADPDAGVKPGRDLDILYTGQLYAWKGVHTVIEALRFTRKPWRLTIVGGNNPADQYILAKMAENWGLSDRIDWIGQVPQTEARAYQARAKVGVAPLPWSHAISRWHTSPIKIIEMMAAGTCILASAVPALRGLLEDGITARFARAEDPRDWAAKLDELLRDEPRREALAAEAKRAALRLTYDARADRVIQAVREIA